jgi:hypothetical protein
MLSMDVYRSDGNVFEMPLFVDSILRENGGYLNTALFGNDDVTSHNAIFAVVLHTDASDAWVTSTLQYQATVCYDLRFLPVAPGSTEHKQFLSIFDQIMQCKVNLLGFSSFERAIGLYTQLLRVLCADNTEYCGMFRRDANNMADMHLHLVLQRFVQDPRWRCARTHTDPALWRCERRESWCDFFDDVTRLYWYHEYVMSLVGGVRREGYSVCNVEAAAFDIAQAKPAEQTHEQLATRRAKQSLLDLLKKAYKYRFD